MATRYNVRFEGGDPIVTPAVEPRAPPEGAQKVAAGVLVRSNQLGPFLGAAAGNGDDTPVPEGGNPRVGSGGNPPAGPGADPPAGPGADPPVSSGGNPRVGSGGNPRVGSGGNPRVGSGDANPCGTDGSGVIAVVLRPGGCAGRPGPSMPFQVETQEESNWCWAAVTSAVDRYYSPNSFLSQCEVVTQREVEVEEKKAKAAETCLNPDEHNHSDALEKALNAIGMDKHLVDGTIDFLTLQGEIDAGRPVCAAIDWRDGGTHFVVLCGYQRWTDGSNVLETVDVADPFYPDSTRTFADFPDFYHGGGEWVQTYLTR